MFSYPNSVKMLAVVALMSGCAGEETATQDLISTRDASLTLVQDGELSTIQRELTSLSYSTYLGFAKDDWANAVAVDGAGNTYITGITASFGGTTNVFVAKMGPTGNNIYFTYFPGWQSERSGAIAVDRWGNTYIVSANSAGQPILMKLDATGTSIVYRVTLDWNTLGAIKADSSGNVYLAGSVLRNSGDIDVAVGKVDPSGTRFVFAVSFGGTNLDSARSVDFDSMGNVYVAGDTFSTNFPVVNAYQTTLRGDWDAFIAKVNATGTSLVFSTYLGGDGRDYATGIAVDRVGGWVYSTGTTCAVNGIGSFPYTGSGAQKTFGGGSCDAFVAQIHPYGSIWATTYLGGNGDDVVDAIAVSNAGNPYVSGRTLSSNFPTTSQAFQPSAPAGMNGFVTQLNPALSAFIYATYLGGSDYDEACSIAVDASGNAYVAGSTNSTDFPTNVYAAGGVLDAFVTKFNGP
jgi:hypothetical protein